MAETLDELTYDYEDEGVLVRKQLDKVVLTKGSWADADVPLPGAGQGRRHVSGAQDRHRALQEIQGQLPQTILVQCLEREASAPDHRSLRGWYAKMGEASEPAEAAEPDDAPESGEGE